MEILRLLFRFKSEYSGYPLYVSGNALRHALSAPISTSIGIFTNKSDLKMISYTYNDFFKIRSKRAFLQPIISARYPDRDAVHNKKFKHIFYYPKFVSFDVIGGFDVNSKGLELVDLIQKKELIQLGGNRNLGYGIVELQDYFIISLEDIIMPEMATHAVLISPLINIPECFEPYACRMDSEVLWNNGKKRKITIIPPGQFFRLKKGIDIKKVAISGILRSTPKGVFGYGEFYLNNWSSNNER
ncbi:MAG: hypothetical protein ACTSPY_08565 [Candidatus Helarchaeota archaeon]